MKIKTLIGRVLQWRNLNNYGIKIHEYSIQEIENLSRSRRIFCIGIGAKFYEMIKRYHGRRFLRRIEYLYDNNVLLWGKQIKIEENRILVHSPDVLKQFRHEKILILITTNRTEEIAKQLQMIFSHSYNMVCSKYPEVYYTYVKILRYFFYHVPVAERFLFHVASEPYENTKAIVSYLCRSKKAKDLVFLADGRSQPNMLLRGRNLKKDTLALPNPFLDNLRYCYYYATACTVFYENTPISKANKHQKLVFLNHGTIPLKNVRGKMVQPIDLDYAVCPSVFCSIIYEEQYGIPKSKLLFSPPPRIDWLWKRNIRHKTPFLPADGRKIVLWLPTFRELEGTKRVDGRKLPFGVPLIRTWDLWSTLNKMLGDYREFLMIKLHPRGKERLQLDNTFQNIYVVQEKELENMDVTLQELLSQTDALLTDYSGIAFEYLLLNHPIGYVLEDVEEYLPGFAVDCPEDFMPGEKIRDMSDLELFLYNVFRGKDVWKEERVALRDKIFPIHPQSCAYQLIEELEKRQNDR